MARYHQPFTINITIATLSLILLSQVRLVTSTCYGGDHDHTAQMAIYTPCNQNTPFSMCLRTQIAGSPPDTRCLPNGLALSPDSGAEFWREGCTDPTWKSEYCLNAFNACPNDGNGNAQVTPCSGDGNSTTWCCGGANTACCGQAGAITIAAILGPSSTSSSASSTSLPTTSPSSTASSSVSPTSTSAGTGLSVGAEAGIGVGVSLAGLAILGGVIWFVLRTRRRRRENVERSGNDSYFHKPALDVNTRYGQGGEELANLKEPRLRHELDGRAGLALRSELPTS